MDVKQTVCATLADWSDALDAVMRMELVVLLSVFVALLLAMRLARYEPASYWDVPCPHCKHYPEQDL